MPIIIDRFREIADAIRGITVDAETRMREAANEISRLLFRAVAQRQPIGLPDSWDLSTTSSMRQGHTTIRDGWGEGPRVFSESPHGVVVSLSNVSEHIKYHVWSVGGVTRPYLGTRGEYTIPREGRAKDVYGHPLAFWWQKKMKPMVVDGFVTHPGSESTLMSRFGGKDFIQAAWQGIEIEAGSIAYQAARKTAFDRLRRIWSR